MQEKGGSQFELKIHLLIPVLFTVDVIEAKNVGCEVFKKKNLIWGLPKDILALFSK